MTMLLFVQNKQDYTTGHIYAVALFLSALFSSIAIHQLYGECNRMSVQIKAALTVLIYRKSLKLSRVRGGAGEVINVSRPLETGKDKRIIHSDTISPLHYQKSPRFSQLTLLASMMSWSISTSCGLRFWRRPPSLSLPFSLWVSRPFLVSPLFSSYSPSKCTWVNEPLI